MNAAIFGSYLRPVWQFNTPKSISEAAERISSAYHISNVGQSTTPYAAPLINGDKTLLKTFLELGMTINFYGGQAQSTISTIVSIAKGAVGGNNEKVQVAEKLAGKYLKSLVVGLPPQLSFIGVTISTLTKGIFAKLKTDSKESSDTLKMIKQLEGLITMVDTTKIGFLIMSTGFCLYWLSSTISPVPPMPPCIAPTFGSRVVFPGTPVPLNSDLYNTFKSPQTPDEAIVKFYNSLILHQFSIIGIYGGIIPFFPTPIAGPPIPWFSILNIPFPNIKLPKILDKDGDGKKDPKTPRSGSGATGGSAGGTTGGQSGGQGGTQMGTGGVGGGQQGGTQTGGQQGGGQTGGQSGGNTNVGGGGTSTGGGYVGQGGTGTVGSGNSSTNFENNPSNAAYNPPSSISTFLRDETLKILSSMNPYGVTLNTDVNYKPLVQLVVEIRENTNLLNNGETEYQYSITVTMGNLAQNKRLNGSKPNLPFSIGESRKYTFRDVVEGNNSIYTNIIMSPKLRAIELMKGPYRSALSSVIGEQVKNYIDKWYGGQLPSQLQTVSFYASTTIADAGDRIGSNEFIPLQKFNALK